MTESGGSRQQPTPAEADARAVLGHNDDPHIVKIREGYPPSLAFAYRPRYAIGHIAWWVHSWEVPGRKPCPTCGGTAAVRLADSNRFVVCPDSSVGTDPRSRCSGGTVPDPESTERRCYIEPRTIGQVRIEVTFGQPVQVSYMAEETGIGSGSVLPEDKLYPSHTQAKLAAGDAKVIPYGSAP